MTKQTSTKQPINWVFDFDGTIADTLPAFIAVFNKTVRGNKDPMSPEEIQALRGLSSRKALAKAGVRWWQVPKLIVQGIGDFHALVPTVEPFKDMPEVIKELYVRGDKLFIVTSNTRESVDTFLLNHELDGFFTDIATGASLFNKAKYIRRLMKQNNLKRKNTLYIGDETRDVQAARLALIKIVSVSWGFNTEKILRRQRPSFLVHRPKDILKITLKGTE